MRSFLIALGFLTKIPVLRKISVKERDLGKSMVWFPLVGLLLGLILSLANTALQPFLPPRLLNLVLILVLTLLTGAIHLDGLADTMDGLCSKSRKKEEILKIMRDSRIGTMGVIAILISILFKYEALNAVPAYLKGIALILICSISRWSHVFCSYFSKYARPDKGLGKPFIGNVGKKQFVLSTIMITFIALLTWRIKAVLILCLVTLLALIMMRYIKSRIGGLTGDTIGAISEVVEMLVLMFIWTMGVGV